MDTAIYTLSMPIDVCNIIISYAMPIIKQAYVNNSLAYICNDKTHNYNTNYTIGIINNNVYSLSINGRASDVIDIAEAKTQMVVPDRIYIIKYANGLICEHYETITIYDVLVANNIFTVTARCSRKFSTKGLLLLYADSNYIIIKIDNMVSSGITIYNNNLEHCKTILTTHPVSYVALVDDVLSYCMIIGQWYVIKV
jgi:hypothetical protein